MFNLFYLLLVISMHSVYLLRKNLFIQCINVFAEWKFCLEKWLKGQSSLYYIHINNVYSNMVATSDANL